MRDSILDPIFEKHIRRQRPYYLLEGKPIAGVDRQHWLVFQHRDYKKQGNWLQGLVSLFSFKGQEKPVSHRILRIDPTSATVFTYHPRQDGDIPTTTLLRVGTAETVGRFLHLHSQEQEMDLLAGSLREVQGIKRRYTLPDVLNDYNLILSQLLERSSLYRRSTAYFDSGVLKLYEEPLRQIIASEGQIRLLMDWQGFTKTADVAELEKLQDPSYRAQFASRTLQEFLQALEQSDFNSTEILGELVRLEFLQIRLIKMQSGRAIYHKKTGIFSDIHSNQVIHEGSDNFTRAAHSRNGESVMFLWSWGSEDDREVIQQTTQEFDEEWQREDISFDLSQEFLRQVLQERERRQQQKHPRVDLVTPDQLPPGETTPIEVTGENLGEVEAIETTTPDLIQVSITNKTPTSLTAEVTVSPDHPPQSISDFIVKTPDGSYTVTPDKSPTVQQRQELPDFGEIAKFRESIQRIQTGDHGTPDDFLYWCAQQRQQQFRIEQSDLLDDWVAEGILFEHQKTGAQHCLRVMEDFGIAVCADAVGLGKTRLAATVARLYRHNNGEAKIAIIAARKLHSNWQRELEELGFRERDYELYNKNLMSRKKSGFQADFDRYGGPDLVIIDEAHEGIRNYNNRIHKLCLEIREADRRHQRQRHFLLLTATPWNNRREDIYNLLSPFLTRPQGFTDHHFPSEVKAWFETRDTGVENFTDNTPIFRRVYKELFLQRTRQKLRESPANLTAYAQRKAEWLPVEFEATTEQALEQIFTRFETELYIPFADPVRYLKENPGQRALLANQRRFFLQRAESSMYALQRTIDNFRRRINLMKEALENLDPTPDGLYEFLLEHYGFGQPETEPPSEEQLDREAWLEDFGEEEEEEEEETPEEQNEKRQQLRRTIDLAIEELRQNPGRAEKVHQTMLNACDSDLAALEKIKQLLAKEFVTDHKREVVTQQVRSLIAQGHKVLLISTFSDTVIDYYRYMGRDPVINAKGIGLAIGSHKYYFPSDSGSPPQRITPHGYQKGTGQYTGLKRQDLFRLFAPAATCRNPSDRPKPELEIQVLIGSETLSVGQNLQDADYLINIDLPWNPMTLEQRIGRIDRPKQRPTPYIYIYYANSESQLLRQASRLKNLNKKLVGADFVRDDQTINPVDNISALGASIYGDTLFDDAILPGYIEFLQSLVKARSMDQESFQEQAFTTQETQADLYSEQELLFSEAVSQRLKAMGADYLPNPIALGSATTSQDPAAPEIRPDPQAVAVLDIQYFGPNGEPIPDRQEQVFWTDLTGERDGFGQAISAALTTPRFASMLKSSILLDRAQALYNSLVKLKTERLTQLVPDDEAENINITNSERIARIHKRIQGLSSLREKIDRKTVKDSLKKLNTWKSLKSVTRLLKNFTDGSQSKLEDEAFITELLAEVDRLNLMESDQIQAVSLKVTLSALLWKF
jgi:superfamily II DNA or RNA helicase